MVVNKLSQKVNYCKSDNNSHIITIMRQLPGLACAVSNPQLKGTISSKIIINRTTFPWCLSRGHPPEHQGTIICNLQIIIKL